VQPIPEGLVILSQDITERKKHERGLIEAKERAEEMSRLKSTLLTNMSHEIRTPLTAIIGFSDFLQKGVKPEQREEFAQLINMSAHRLMETLNSVMDLAQLEGGGLKLEPRRVNVNSQVRETISLFDLQAREKGLRLTFHASETPVEALLDPVALNRVLTNLLANALKFTHTGSIIVAVEARDKQVEIRVQDTGIGISKSFLPRIFDEFKQESEGLARDYEGNGLGLTITKQLVELMEGQIDVESEKGKGSTFRIVLPALSSGAAVGLRSTPWHPAQPGQPAVKRHLLLVEDNVVTRKLMMHLLSETFDVQAVADGPSALERAACVRYDAVLLDINLGIGMSGEEVLLALRDLPGYSNVPMMAVTAHALPGDRDRFLKHGFDGYLSKPFTSEQLLQALALVPELKPPPERPGDESLTELLQMCMNRGLIDRYELDDASLVLVSEIAHYRLTRQQAPVALHALLGA
jgi:CheY-like chemotaxis protein